MYFGITDLTTFVLGTIFVVMLPGPNSLYVMTVASRCGVRPGYQAACGIFLGDLVLMTLSASGVATLLQTTPGLFLALKVIGAAYLIWLGIDLLRTAVGAWRGIQQDNVAADMPAITSKPFRRAFAISLVNPKAILFFVSFFIQFVSPDYPYPVLSFLILAAIAQLCSVIYLSALIFGGTHLAGIFRTRRHVASLATGGVGVLFIGFAISIAISAPG
jgi:leucine efflux protein